MKFTSSQKEAIHSEIGNLQLIACAGSGKTEVMARRVVHLLDPRNDAHLAPENIVAFTFTDKAAAELKERIFSRIKEELGEINGFAEMFIGTIHSFGLNLLKSEVPEYLKYEVLNEVQQMLFVDRYSSKSGFTTSTDLRGNNLKRYRDTGHFISALSVLRESECQNEILKGCSMITGLEAYRDFLGQKSYFDYSSILESTVKELMDNGDVKSRLSERIKYVIVDEYQDINPIQEKMIQELHKLGAYICVVGDDDQTIYQWRGSDVGNILSFAQRYPSVKKIPIENNFRSSNGIVETARAFIRKNKNRLSKEMKSANAQKYESGDIVALSFDTPEEEAAYIAKTIKNLKGVAFEENDMQRGLSWSDMAILLRSVKRNAEPIIEALKREQIPFVVVGMNNLFETPEAKAARSLFYFMACMVVDLEGFIHVSGDGSSEELEQTWMDLGCFSHNKLSMAVQSASATRDAMNSENQGRWSRYSIQRVFIDFLEKAGICEIEALSVHKEMVLYNLGKFSQIISDFETIHYLSKPVNKYMEFAKFLMYGAENYYPEGWQSNQHISPDAVQIVTVHQAKGMQWPVVFVPALLRNRFPSKRSGGRNIWHLIPKEGIKGYDRFSEPEEDERRLFYVAMTRSQKFLHLTWAPIRGNRLYARPSAFWEEILESKYVKRRISNYKSRKHLPSSPRLGIANVIFSFSDLKYFFECPYQFKLRVLYGFNMPIDPALGYGSSLHDILAEVHTRAIRGDIADHEEVSHLVETHLHTPYAHTALRETMKGAAERVIRNYLTDNAKLFDKIEFSEKNIEINLERGVSISGRIDLVRRLDSGEVSIVDLKSSDRAQGEEVTETQLHVYALGYQYLTGRLADYVEIYELDERKRKPRSVDNEFIAEVQDKVQEAAGSLRENELLPKPSPKKCGTCDYRGMCAAAHPDSAP